MPKMAKSTIEKTVRKKRLNTACQDDCHPDQRGVSASERRRRNTARPVLWKRAAEGG